MTDKEEKQVRELNMDRPLNVHENLKTNPIGYRYTISGDYLYYHYM